MLCFQRAKFHLSRWRERPACMARRVRVARVRKPMELQRPEAPHSSAFGTFSRQREKENPRPTKIKREPGQSLAPSGNQGIAPKRDAVCRDADYAARLAFAFSARAPKALMSCMAMSASTLRSTVTPAFFRPFIMRLYDRPY